MLEREFGDQEEGSRWQWKNASASEDFLLHTLSVARFWLRLRLRVGKLCGVSFLVPVACWFGCGTVRWSVEVSGYEGQFKDGIVIEPDGVFGIRAGGRVSYFFL